MARLKISISLENVIRFNLLKISISRSNDDFFQNLGPLGLFSCLTNTSQHLSMAWTAVSRCEQFWIGGPDGSRVILLKSRRVTIRGAQPSARLSEEICLSEGSAGVSQRAPRGLSEASAGSLRGSARVRRSFRGFSGVVTLCL